MRTSGDTTVRATASRRAVLVTALLSGAALLGTAAYADADETARPAQAVQAVQADHSDHSDAPAVRVVTSAPRVLTQLARPRFTQPR